MMRHFVTRLWGQTEDRESAPPQGDFARRTTDPLDDETLDDTPAIDLPDPATLDVHSNFRPFLRETVPAELTRLALMIAIIIGHVYLGSFGVQGSFDAMSRGDVDYEWARTHHPLWVGRIVGRERGNASPQAGK